MKRSVFILIFTVFVAFAAPAQVKVGMTDTAAYYPLLRGRRVAVLANQTSVAELPGTPGADAAGRVHLVDLLHGEGFDMAAIFSPEHGFRGTADAGEHVASSVDARTGIPIRSLYDGNAKRPSDEAMRSFDVLVVDMQDVGLRFYTYYISMLRMMDACADFGKRVVVLDRPNPNGHLVDGPVLDMKYQSGVGAIPVPVLHGLTMGEIARMAVGEGWAKPCGLTVVKCRNYTHATQYRLPVAPSPNLPTQRAVCLYAALCPFEGTVVSLGRGTDSPFEIYGHPRYDRARLFLYAAPHGRGQESAARRPAVPRCRPAPYAALRGPRSGILAALRDRRLPRSGAGGQVLYADVRKTGRCGMGARDDRGRGFRRRDPRPLGRGGRALPGTAGAIPALRIA